MEIQQQQLTKQQLAAQQLSQQLTAAQLSQQQLTAAQLQGHDIEKSDSKCSQLSSDEVMYEATAQVTSAMSANTAQVRTVVTFHYHDSKYDYYQINCN